MAGITSYGTYIPYHRLPRSVINEAWGRGAGRGEKAVASFDEDTITISVAAGLSCLNGMDPKAVDTLFMASTSAPYKEGLNSTIAATALDFRPNVRTADFANCLRAGTTALLSAVDAVKSGSAKKAMVAAADVRIGGLNGENELAFGDGGVAFLLGNDKVIAEIEGNYTLSAPLFDNWRASDDTFVRSWEDRFGLDEGYMKIPVEAAHGVMRQCGLAPGDFAKACFYGPSTRRHADLGKKIGFQPAQIQDPMLDTVGNTGVSHCLMTLAAALDDAKTGDLILLLSWGNGSDALVLRVTGEIHNLTDRGGVKRLLATRRVLDSYQKYLRWRKVVPLEPVARPDNIPTSLASLWREHRYTLPLYGFKCRKCNTPQLYLSFASSRARFCVECQAADSFEDYKFADKKAKVVSFSHDYLDRSDDPPNTLTVVDFIGGGRGSFAMADRDPEECKVGMSVEMTFRKMRFERGIHAYYWKCKPIRD